MHASVFIMVPEEMFIVEPDGKPDISRSPIYRGAAFSNPPKPAINRGFTYSFLLKLTISPFTPIVQGAAMKIRF